VGLLPPFFRLTSAFFGLTSEYKAPLLEEIYICTQYLKGVSYNDVLSMPTYERRYFLGMLTKDAREKQEEAEKFKEEAKARSNGSKGSRTTRVSGDALKNKMKTGEIPTT
jgi:hypothetical protein